MQSRFLLVLMMTIAGLRAVAQTGDVQGTVTSKGEPVPFTNLEIKDTDYGAVADSVGNFRITDLPVGDYSLVASAIGYQKQQQTITITNSSTTSTIEFELLPSSLQLDQIVVTGTRTFKRQTQSAVIVNVIDRKTLDNVQACNLSEGLRFQPGLRVETDCQTCNYTQLRMNGLGGGYSQILINGRPIFSPLTGLYGMEQIPANMIERIEVVRGGGSALYGSSAIGGTVNIITRIPEENAYNLSYTYQNFHGDANDMLLNGNATMVNKEGNAGASIFIGNRKREAYDHNADNFSELPELRNNSFGANLFYQPTDNQKLELSLTSLSEYRYGGEMVNEPAHLARQSEERDHDVWMGSLDYQLNFNQDNSSFIAYLAGQSTDREHYTGIIPDDSTELLTHLAEPPYGYSENTTWQGGVQLNHRLNKFLGGENVLTVGAEYVSDDVLDVIESYDYRIDQQTNTMAGFIQSDWELSPRLTFLSGLRIDKHNLVEDVIYSPRLSVLYRLKETTQFRLTWGTGFRAPQAFDADLHIAFAGGGISRISLSPDLKEERSNSLSASVNFDKATETFIGGFTLEGFYTHLNDAFYLHPLGADAFGERFEKRNGDGATVKGLTLELRANYDQKAQLEAGFTIQSSLYDSPVEHIDGLEPRREFMRTPNEYGYATLSLMPSKPFNASINWVYTGPMQLPHLAGAPEQDRDEYVTTPDFSEIGLKLGYTFALPSLQSGLELFGGIKNLTNAYQSDFDSGKNRDSNYVYGPGMPRTYFVGMRLKSL